MYSIISDHLDTHAPISNLQWGFQRNKSTVTALLSVTHDWFSILDKRSEVYCVFFDFQKAFDTVPHKQLMLKLKQLRLHPQLLQWIHNYLCYREQSVIVNGESSYPVQVKSGVPQGSVLGPLLFLIYINDITSLQLSSGTQLSLYADDILMYKAISSSTDYVSLQSDIDAVYQWAHDNLLTFNRAKCKCMLISKRKKRMCPTMTLNGEDMELVQKYKYLGVTVCDNLSWSTHIQQICVKARKILGLLYRKVAKHTSDQMVVLKLYLALVRPHLEYASQVWSPYMSKDVQLLEKVQKFALRICSKCYLTEYEELLELFDISSLENRRLFLSLCTLYNIINKFCYFPSYSLPSLSSSSKSRTHHSVCYKVPFARTTYLQHSFLHTVIPLWNNLPSSAVTSASLPMFKYLVSPLFS